MSDRYIRWKSLRPMIADVGRTTVWRWVREGRFPKPVKIGKSASAWLFSEIEKWIEERANAR